MDMRNLLLPIAVAFVALLSAQATGAPGADGGYLFATFRGEANPMTEQVYFAASDDGHKWDLLKGGEPVLVSQLGEKGVRDPFLIRAPDGATIYLIATDLSIARDGSWHRAVTAGSKSVVIWESTDLVNWSDPRLVKVAPDDAGCTWAPEAIYDQERGEYLIYWASTTGRDEFKKHRIWASRTRDFKTFSEPYVYIDKSHPIIDTDIVRDGSKYYRFSKDEKSKTIMMETADHLDGPWHDVAGFTLRTMVGFEGPQCFRFNAPAGDSDESRPAWCLLLDHYAKGQGYQPFVSQDLSTGNFQAGEAFTFPFKFRHGSVLPITPAERDRLKVAFGAGKTGQK
jgi:arabinoxylan arabinofuranohydrolase